MRAEVAWGLPSPTKFAKCPTPPCQSGTLDVATSALLLARFASVISIAKYLKIGVVICSAVFERDDVIDMGSFAINDDSALPASERVTYQDPLAFRFPISGLVMRCFFHLFRSWSIWSPTWNLSRHDLSVSQTASGGAGVLLRSAVRSRRASGPPCVCCCACLVPCERPAAGHAGGHR